MVGGCEEVLEAPQRSGLVLSLRIYLILLTCLLPETAVRLTIWVPGKKAQDTEGLPVLPRGLGSYLVFQSAQPCPPPGCGGLAVCGFTSNVYFTRAPMLPTWQSYVPSAGALL